MGIASVCNSEIETFAIVEVDPALDLDLVTNTQLPSATAQTFPV